MPEKFAEKRRFPRIPAEHTVLVKKLGGEAVEEFGKTRVVGLGGCCFTSDAPIGIGSAIEVLISVGGRVVKARGKVIYEKFREEAKLEVGMEFVTIDPRDRQILESLLSEKSEKPS